MRLHIDTHTQAKTHRVNDEPEVSAVNWTLQTPVLGANKPHIRVSTCELGGIKITILASFSSDLLDINNT